jgi:hypothetical protein
MALQFVLLGIVPALSFPRGPALHLRFKGQSGRTRQSCPRGRALQSPSRRRSTSIRPTVVSGLNDDVVPKLGKKRANPETVTALSRKVRNIIAIGRAVGRRRRRASYEMSERLRNVGVLRTRRKHHPDRAAKRGVPGRAARSAAVPRSAYFTELLTDLRRVANTREWGRKRRLAPRAGFEPATIRLTVEWSTGRHANIQSQPAVENNFYRRLSGAGRPMVSACRTSRHVLSRAAHEVGVHRGQEGA